MVHLVSAAAVLALSGLTLSPATALVSAEPISAPRLPDHQPPPPSSSSSVDFAPSAHKARENAVHIFNAVHSAMRQWGSSLHHNGLGLIPATVPKGTLMYHGSTSNSTPDGFEWLAFEMEHSEGFARSSKNGRGTSPPRPPRKGKGPGKVPPGEGGGGPPRGPHGSEPIIRVGGEGSQHPIGADDNDDDDDDDDDKKPNPRRPGGPGDGRPVRGYFHTYRAKRDLKLLYIDGMAAGKTGMGTLDTQDFLLRGLREAPGYGEWDRAEDVCDLVQGWGLDGVIRMEIGFEAIYCDFHNGGLDLVSVLRRPWSDVPEGAGGIDMFEWARAVGQRYDGIGGGRVKLGFGGMVSGFWYPLNVSNPDGRVAMPRLGPLTEEERGVVLGRVGEIVRGAGWGDGRFDWQGVVDMIVTRYGDRIETLADEGADGRDEGFVSQVLTVTNTFVDYPRDASDSAVKRADAVREEEEEEKYVREARERCVGHYLTPATVWREEWTPEDGMVFFAVEAVVQRLCGDLFDVRGLVLRAMPALAGAFSEAEIRRVVNDGDEDDEKLENAVKGGRKIIQTLKEDLGWSSWKKCKPGCDVGEMCFIAMWPFGLKEDHFHPSCQNRSSLVNRGGRGSDNGYWEFEPRP
ncbi:hypothetical protein CORC01_09773 [Colletotrichum orchidophilum]|uniref:Uncharacterized protein n=1 Tax=Colletotrichum orchidophilum TaxID=1209926 RepID=A0A1G4B0M7_9PEZI|nr:uncharacterized protein CORC01_09773 [Colletotrichum orchidophilum]OHE94979.1 hypothetical protein CORC01_09773 [Colletotrichum orchidophilum]